MYFANTLEALLIRFVAGVLLCCITANAVSQSCNGNLGENIFSDGDFGSGIDNIVSPDPGIAPGFQYVFSGPPRDGEYTITNNTAAWPGLYQPWLGIGDNSAGLDGYMMVVNASFSPGLFYEQTIDGLCENSEYEFSADIINLIKQNTEIPHLKPNVTFIIDGEVNFTTGEIPQNTRWNTYAFAFSTNPGQTSVTLALRNNAPGGIGNDLGLDNISFKACGPLAQILPLEVEVTCEDGEPVELLATIEGDQYSDPQVQWQTSIDGGQTWNDIPGATRLTYLHTELQGSRYYYRYLLANGVGNLSNEKCRVVSNEKIVFVQHKFYNIIDTICEGLSFTVGSSTYDRTGIYLDSLTSFYGCDSIITTKLTITPDTQVESDVLGLNPSCSYLSDGMLIADPPSGGLPPFRFSLNDSTVSNGRTLSSLPEGTYSYKIEDRYGCSFEEQVVLTSPPPYTINLGPNRSLDLGDESRISVQVSGGLTQSISWTPVDAVICDPPCIEFVLQPTSSLQVVAEASNENGCSATDSIFLEVLKVRKYYFPTAFSPNGDGVNDYFIGFGASPNVQLIEQLLVADRWGNILFNKTNLLPNDQLAGWDGTASAKTLDEGVYIYSARIRYFDGEVEQVSGEVNLMR